MKLKFTISEVSKIFDISVDNLRFYDRIGLFKPYHVGDNGYRYYYLSQFDTLATIKILKNVGVSLDEIHNLLNRDNLDNLTELLLDKKHQVQQKIEYLKLAEQKLDELSEQITDFCDKNIKLKMSPRFWAILTESVMESSDSHIADRIKSYFEGISPFQHLISMCQTVSLISKENIINSSYHTYINNGLVSLHELDFNHGSINVYQPRLCAFKCVVIEEENYTAIDNEYEKIKEWICSNGYDIDGDSMEINVYNQYHKHYIQIWIPVK